MRDFPFHCGVDAKRIFMNSLAGLMTETVLKKFSFGANSLASHPENR